MDQESLFDPDKTFVFSSEIRDVVKHPEWNGIEENIINNSKKTLSDYLKSIKRLFKYGIIYFCVLFPYCEKRKFQNHLMIDLLDEKVSRCILNLNIETYFLIT